MDKKYSTYCCVPQCNNYGRTSLSFYYFPKDKEKRRKWATALRMGKKPSDSMKVCGEHFLPQDFFPAPKSTIKKTRRLLPHALPSQKIPIRTHDSVLSSPKKRNINERADRLHKRNQPRGANDIQDDSDSNDNINGSLEINLFDAEMCQAELLEPSMEDNEKLKEIGVQVDLCSNECPVKFSISSLLTDTEKLYHFTGLRSFDLLDGIVECVADIDLHSVSRKKELPIKERVLLTFVKLKLNLSFLALSVLFEVTRQTASNYFKHTLPLLSKVLESVIPWPDRELIRNNLPLSFQKFQSTRCILDCAETPIEKCHCLRCRVMTYSQYKGRHTLKFFVVTAPSGLITFISECYPGRSSDKFVTLDCGILDKLDFGDGVMVDKGFLIENECLETHLKFIRPPFLKQRKQLSQEDALRTAEIARARVHVERAIQRLREFSFISESVLWELIPSFNNALIVAAAIHNLGPPIINIDKF